MKQRLDVALVERGLAETRAKAQALVMAGEVLVDGQRADKPGTPVAEGAQIEVKAALPYVSRGGLKLAHAIEAFGLAERVVGKVALDIGSSTGGFTDVLLQGEAAHVYAVDVGTNQLAWKLRQDPRVTVMEQTNIRYLETLPQSCDLATCDVSYIGLELVTPPAVRLTTPHAFFVFLIKPQFEAGREQVGKGGVVREAGVHRDVIIRLARYWEAQGLHLEGLARSPITGPAGNVEYLALIEKQQRAGAFDLQAAMEREVIPHVK
ncbi:MAG: TlyA family RNA methyltransferase [Chloroflexota bacterium]|nr:TlyA family RNA methyltransferase [Chloroflexota bacterium]MDQ5864737.1 TlyA family RNA methyltransferase [Chloroflexota bacterium]